LIFSVFYFIISTKRYFEDLNNEEESIYNQSLVETLLPLNNQDVCSICLLEIKDERC